MDDVLVVGAGPAGSIAATLLARAGARVRVIDRSTFPRDKLCGDTVNPGTVAALERLGLAADLEARSHRIHGMRVTGEGGVAVEGRYPDGQHGLALSRRELDWALLQRAVAAGATVDVGVAVRDPLVDGSGGPPAIRGVVVAGRAAALRMRARVVIGADGRRSTIAFALRLARHPPRPRRWAIGAYYESVDPIASLGEMHIRRGRYLGVAPLGRGMVNVCLVRAFEPRAGDCEFGNPAELLRREIAAEPMLRDRFADREPVRAPLMLGPLAVDLRGDGIEGLILAGDAAGFIDPMTGDGLRFAVVGGELAAHAALDALDHGWNGVHARLGAARRREFAAKWRFNRALRALVASPSAVRAAAVAAGLAPGAIRRLIARAGDCPAC